MDAKDCNVFYCDSINPISVKWLELTGIMFTRPEKILRPFHGTPIGLIAGKLHLRVPSVSSHWLPLSERNNGRGEEAGSL